MVRQAAGELAPLEMPAIRPRAARSRCGSMRRIPAKDFQPSAGRLSRRRLADRGARGNVGGVGHGSYAVITIRCWPRSSCAARIARRRWRACAPRSRECRVAGIETNLRVSAAGGGRSGVRGGRHHDFVSARLRLSAPRDRRDRGGDADDRAGLIRGGSGTGTSACRRRVRWTRWRFASPIDWWAMRSRAAGLEIAVIRAVRCGSLATRRSR